jgi:hypothetical protein
MTPDDAAKALPIVGTVSALGQFLPGVGKAYEASPDDSDFAQQLRTSERTYLLWALMLGLLGAYAHKSMTTLWLVLAFAGTAVWMHEHAFSQQG